MADKTTTLKTKTNDNVYPNVIGDNRDNAISDSAHIKHILTADHKINFRLDDNVSNLIFNSLQKPSGLTKTELVGVGTNGQENIEIGDNLTLANGKLSATGGSSGGEGGISVIELTDKNGTIASTQLSEITANPQNFAFKYNGKILLFTSSDSTTYQYCNNTTNSSDNNVMTTSILLTIKSSTGAYTIAENVHNVVANSIHSANGGDLTNIQVGSKVYSIPSGGGAELPAGTENDPLNIGESKLYNIPPNELIFEQDFVPLIEFICGRRIPRILIDSVGTDRRLSLEVYCNSFNNATIHVNYDGARKGDMYSCTLNETEKGLVYSSGTNYHTIEYPSIDGIYNLQLTKNGTNYNYAWVKVG